MAELTQAQKEVCEEKVLKMLIPALNKHMTAKEGWNFLDTINPILSKSGSPWVYMLFGDGFGVVLAENLKRCGDATQKAEITHGSSIGWDTFKHT